MKLELNGNILVLNGKETRLNKEQLKELGIKLNPFDIKGGDTVYFIDYDGEVENFIYDITDVDVELLQAGKICRDEDLMEQKALHQNLNDLLWKFTNENGWSEEVWEDAGFCKWYILFDYAYEIFSINGNHFTKIQGITYFISQEIAQRAIDEIVLPYMEEYPEFVW